MTNTADMGAGAGAGAPPATPPAAAAPPPANGAQPPAPGTAPMAPATPYRPQGLPDNWMGNSNPETIDRLYGVAKGLRDQVAQFGAVPKDPSGYSFGELGPDVKPFLGMDDNDKALKAFREVAHRNGMPDKTFSKMLPEFVGEMVKQGILQRPMSADEIHRELAPPTYKGDDGGRAAAGQARLNDAIRWTNNLTDAQGFTQGMRDMLASIATTKDGLAVIEQFAKGGIQNSFTAPGGSGSGGLPSRDELRQRENDPRNDYLSPQYDPGFAAETQRLWKAVVGE